MNQRSYRLLTALLCTACVPSLASARALVTRPVTTIGQFAFEAELGVWQRQDTFESPKSTYKTVGIPGSIRFGLAPHWDLGFNFDSYTQTLDSGGIQLSGSRNGLVSPEIKVSFLQHFGLLTIWHAKQSELSGQELPIARGDDFEFLALAEAPTAWPLTLNAGYLYRNPYHSGLGVENTSKVKVEPGNVWEARGALEIPLFAHISGLGELAYYKTESKFVNHVEINGSAGEAMDALLGLNWGYKEWNLGGGVAFGLLDERHTSFDLERGAGDVTWRLRVVYHLQPKKAGS